jgi:hypothetical protein
MCVDEFLMFIVRRSHGISTIQQNGNCCRFLFASFNLLDGEASKNVISKLVIEAHIDNEFRVNL